MLSVIEASKIIGLSRQQTNTFFKSQQIPCTTIRGKRYAALDDVRKFTERHNSRTWLKDCLISGEIIHVADYALFIRDAEGQVHKISHRLTDLVGIPYEQLSTGFDVEVYPIYRGYQKFTVISFLNT